MTHSTAAFVPLFVGRGRLARHLIHDFESRKAPFSHFADARRISSSLHDQTSLQEFRSKLSAATHVWLLVSDQALTRVAAQIRELKPDVAILHSSAAVPVPGAATLHPLMTFSHELYPPAFYPTLPWTTFEGEEAPEIALYPRRTELPQALRVQYHAACVMMSNFSQILWSAGESLCPGLSRDQWSPILHQSLTNYLQNGIRALTGPISRGDTTTIRAHQAALEGQPVADLYNSFVQFTKTAVPSPEVNHDHSPGI